MPIKLVALIVVLAAIVLSVGISISGPKSHDGVVSDANDMARKLIVESFHSDGRVVLGPDGFPYIIALRSGTAPGALYSMDALARLALADRAGISIYQSAANEGLPVAVFSLGDTIVLAQGLWETAASGVDPVLQNGEHVTIGTPSRTRLPDPARQAVAKQLRDDGVATPKIALMVVQNAAGGIRGAFMMTANLSRSHFKTDKEWVNALSRVQWYLPPSVNFIRPPLETAGFNRIFSDVKPVLH